MKPGRGAILICGPGPWRLGAPTDAGMLWIETGISPDADAAQISEKLPAAMARLPVQRNRSVVVALPSNECLAASIATNALPRSDRRRAMEYRLEGKLPLAIEDVSADFITHNGRALGICVRTEKIGAAIDAIRGCGVGIAAVCPTAILSFQAGLPRVRDPIGGVPISPPPVIRGRARVGVGSSIKPLPGRFSSNRPPPQPSPGVPGEGEEVPPLESRTRLLMARAADPPDAIVWRAGESADVFLLEGGELVQWHWVPATAADISLILASHSMAQGRSLRLALRGSDEQWSTEIGGLPNTQIISHDAVAMDDAAFQTATRVLAAEIEPLVNFRHEAPGSMSSRQPLIAALVACLFLGLSLIGGAILRANRYASLAAGFDDQERAIFQQLFPGEAVPEGVESRLLSYAQGLDHPTASASADSPPEAPSSLTLLFNVLTDLPTGTRFQFDDLQFDSGRTTLHGRASSLAETDEIAAALRKTKTLLVDDPQIQQLADGGVAFTIAARERGLP